MSLIDKAAQRMGRSRTDSLLERAAARGFASGQSAREQQESQPTPKPSPGQESLQGTPRVFPQDPEAPVAAPTPRRSTEIKIDLARLKARGFISPDGRRS